MPSTMLPLRDAFVLPKPADAIELRAFTHGLMPKTVPAMLQRFCEDWARHGVDAWNCIPNHWRPASDETVGWWSLPEYLGDEFIAPLLGAPAGSCIMQPNVHWSMQCLLSAPELAARGPRIVLSETEFPSTLHSVQRWAPALGYRVEIVPAAGDDFFNQNAYLDAITREAGLALLSHVGFTTGEKLPDDFLREVARRAQAAGALFVVDGYHATASVPVDVEALGADVYLGGLLKEGSGSSGTSFIYLRPGLDLHPRTTGWFGDAEPFAFKSAPTSHPNPRRRFLGGTTAIAPLYHAVEGVRLLLEVGLEEVRRYSLSLTGRALEHIDHAGLSLCSPREAERRSAMIILEAKRADLLCAALKRKHVYTDSRKGRYLRLAPFVWNTRQEVDRTFDLVEEMISSGRYLAFEPEEGQAGPVT